MSRWTHVVGAFRVDSMSMDAPPKAEDIEKVLGPMCLFDTWDESSTLPRGSEGSLQYHVHVYREGGNLPWAVVSVWGDLRDYDSDSEIKKWWEETLDKLERHETAEKCFFTIRDAVLCIALESRKKPTILYRQ